MPTVDDVPKAAGNNWNDNAFKTAHKRKQFFGVDQPNEPPERPVFKVGKNVDLSTPDVPLAASLNEVYQQSLGEATSPSWLSLDDKVLRFSAYFRETVNESSETDHIRKVLIHFYNSDNSIMISEPAVTNSGIQGGVLLRRHKVAPSMENKRGTRSATKAAPCITVNDFEIGEEITMYGRTYHIVDCDAATRDFYASLGHNLGPSLPYPTDQYFTEYRNRLEGKEPVRKMDWEDRDIKMGFEQAVMGKTFMHTPEEIAKTKRFLLDDKSVLMFKAIWEDRDSPHGDLRTFEVRFFLCDDTIEVIERVKPNCGRNAGRAFAFRRRLPKTKDAAAHAFDLTFKQSKDPNSGRFYGAEDLVIGAYINVYGRALRLWDCDPFTRQHCRNVLGVEQPTAIDVDKEYGIAPKPPPPNYPPPFNNFGTEEDSLGNWKNLVLKPPKQDLRRWMEFDGKLLRFRAKFRKPPTSEDADRTFMIVFYLGDDTIQVGEVAMRNSGMVGGCFLGRQRVKKYAGEGPLCNLTWRDFYVGAVVNIGGHIFELTETDEFTRRFRYQKYNLPYGINEDVVLYYLAQWQLTDPNTDLQEVVAIGNTQEPDETGRTLLGLMEMYNADHGGGVCMKDFVQAITGDAKRALPECEVEYTDSPSLAGAKADRRRQILAYSGAQKLQREITARGLTLADVHQLITTLPVSKSDRTGNYATNHLHVQFNSYQFFAACHDMFRLDLDPDEVEAMQQEFFPPTNKTMPLQSFITLMNRVKDYGGLPPLKPK